MSFAANLVYKTEMNPTCYNPNRVVLPKMPRKGFYSCCQLSPNADLGSLNIGLNIRKPVLQIVHGDITLFWKFLEM